MVYGIIAAVVVLGLIAVRLLPTDPDRWHQPVEAIADKNFASGAVRVLAAHDGDLARIDAIALAHPRTRRIAGNVEEGRITYVTRTRWIGFPDFTTVELSDNQLRMLARLRFGSNDLGVNRARLDRWIAALRS